MAGASRPQVISIGCSGWVAGPGGTTAAARAAGAQRACGPALDRARVGLPLRRRRPRARQQLVSVDGVVQHHPEGHEQYPAQEPHGAPARGLGARSGPASSHPRKLPAPRPPKPRV